jgi:hypothetical protein
MNGSKTVTAAGVKKQQLSRGNLPPLNGILHQIASAARSAAAFAADHPGWMQSIGIAAAFFDREVPEKLVIGRCFARRTKPNELVRVDLDFPIGFPSASEVRELLKMEIAPFIIGVGTVRVEDTPEGIVIAGIDEQQQIFGHDIRS